MIASYRITLLSVRKECDKNGMWSYNDGAGEKSQHDWLVSLIHIGEDWHGPFPARPSSSQLNIYRFSILNIIDTVFWVGHVLVDILTLFADWSFAW